MNMEVGYSLVIPCYNEKENLEALVNKFSSHVGSKPVELILVDNGSADGTGAKIDDLAQAYPFVRKVTVSKNIGYGHGIKTGLMAARGRYVGWTHADMQTDPGDFFRAIKILQSGSGSHTLIKGQRRARKFSELIFSKTLDLIERLIFRANLDDFHAQPNLIHRDFVSQYAQKMPDDTTIELFTLLLAKRKAYEVVRMPVDFLERKSGESKLQENAIQKFKLIFKTLRGSLRMKRHLKDLECV